MHLFYQAKPTMQVENTLERKTKMNASIVRTLKVVMLSIIFVLVLIPSTIYTVQSMTDHADQESSPQVYTVSAGDTLWNIAQLHAPNDMDIRKYIDEIRRVNELRTSMLTVGQQIQLP